MKLPFILTNMKVRQAWFGTRLSHYGEAEAVMPADADALMGGDDLEGGWVVAGLEINTLYGMGNFEAARLRLQGYDAY